MMKEWIPIPGSSKDKILKVALEEFGTKGYKGVNITELATKANMTTGAIYHHFGSKANLYEVIKNEMEQRIVDRMEGVISVFEKPDQGLEAALITSLKFAVEINICKLLSDEATTLRPDKITKYLSGFDTNHHMPISIVIISSWRSILDSISENRITLEQGIKLIEWIFNKSESDF